MVRQEMCVVMQDAVITLSQKEFVFVMGQRKGLVVIKDAITGLLIQVYVAVMELICESYVFMKDAAIRLWQKVCVTGTEHQECQERSVVL